MAKTSPKFQLQGGLVWRFQPAIAVSWPGCLVKLPSDAKCKLYSDLMWFVNHGCPFILACSFCFAGGVEMCLMGFCKSLCLWCCVLDACYEYCFVFLVVGMIVVAVVVLLTALLEIRAWCHKVSQDDKSMKAMPPRALEPIYRRWILVTLDRWDTVPCHTSCIMASTRHLGFLFRLSDIKRLVDLVACLQDSIIGQVHPCRTTTSISCMFLALNDERLERSLPPCPVAAGAIRSKGNDSVILHRWDAKLKWPRMTIMYFPRLFGKSRSQWQLVLFPHADISVMPIFKNVSHESSMMLIWLSFCKHVC